MILGRNLIVSIDGVPVAGSKSCQFQISQNFISVCPPTARRVFNKNPTTYDWSMSVDCLIPNSTLSVSLVDKLIAGTRVLLTFTDGSGQNRAGFAYVKSCDEGGSVGSLATFSASFEADGELYKYTAMNNWYSPQFCDGWSIADERAYYDAQSQDSVCYLSFEASKNGKLCIFGNDYWAFFNKIIGDLQVDLGNGNVQSLEENVEAWGGQSGIYAIENESEYTILCNSKVTVLFLHE